MSLKRQLLLLSASSPYGYSYLQYAKNDIEEILNKNNVTEVLFIPYALRDYNRYTSLLKDVLGKWNFSVQGIHEYDDPILAVNTAQVIFIGGGNTFQLLNELYIKELISPIRKRVLEDGIPYIGSSAGTNVATKNICTTNDMPIVYPPSFDALKLIPININPHYLDPLPNDKHRGETREERILQYLEIPNTGPVLGLREGATFYVEGNKAILKGIASARLFCSEQPPKEYEVGTDLSFLLVSN